MDDAGGRITGAAFADNIGAVVGESALVAMASDPEGRKVLQDGADLLKMNSDLGFVAADDREYDNYRKFYKTTQVK